MNTNENLNGTSNTIGKNGNEKRAGDRAGGSSNDSQVSVETEKLVS